MSAKRPAVVDQALQDGFSYLYAAAPKAQRSQLRRLENTWTQPYLVDMTRSASTKALVPTD